MAMSAKSRITGEKRKGYDPEEKDYSLYASQIVPKI